MTKEEMATKQEMINNLIQAYLGFTETILTDTDAEIADATSGLIGVLCLVSVQLDLPKELLMDTVSRCFNEYNIVKGEIES